MNTSTIRDGYSPAAKLIHWSMAFAIVFTFALGLAVDAFPRAFENAVVQTHMVVGIAIVALLVVRLANRVVSGVPAPEAGTTALMAQAAKAGHLVLYAAMVVVPLTGLALTFLRGRGIDFGLFAIPSPIAANRAMSRSAKEIHELAAWGLMVLAAAHAAAAVFHHRVLKDGTLRRMMPSR